MRDINTNQEQYWNGLLSSGTYNGYSEVVNFDIVAPTYTHNRSKLRPTSFYYKKRKGYIDLQPNIAESQWDVSDVVRINEGSCNDEQCREYIMLTDRNNGKTKIITKACECGSTKDLCGNDGIESDDECIDCLCDCGYNKFFVTDFVKGTPRTINATTNAFSSDSGVQENTNNGTVGKFYDLFHKYYPYVNVGDYIYVYSSPNNEGSAVCGQARRIVGIDYHTVDRDYDILLLDSPRAGLGVSNISNVDSALQDVNDARQNLYDKIQIGDVTQINNAKSKLDSLLSLYELERSLGSVISEQKGINGTYAIFPEWGEVVSYATCNGISTIHSIHFSRDILTQEVSEDYTAFTTTTCSGFDSDTCIYSINEFNGRVNLLGSKGYNIYGGLSYNKFMFSSDNTNYIGTDKDAQVVFRNFLVSFSRTSMSVIVYDSTGNSFGYDLDNSIGLFSRNSYTVFQNSLYIVGNDKRLYACDIVSQGQGAGYQLNLTDQSQQIRGELELLIEGDDVYLHNEGNKMYIFMNNKYNSYVLPDSKNSKTKILIYNRDYNRWITHNICNFIVTGKYQGYYIGNSLYGYFGKRDHDSRYSKDISQGDYFEAYLETFIGENEDGSNGRMNTLSMKSPKWAKILLGKGIYTDGSTKFVVDYGTHGRQQQYQVDTVEHIDWIKNNNTIMAGGSVDPDECALSLLAECSNIFRECSNSPHIENRTRQTGYCYPEDEIINDNCICVDDKAFALSDVYNVFIKLDHLKSSELFKIRIISSGGDSMIFGGMMVSMITHDVSVHDVDSEDVLNVGTDCCTSGEYIDLNKECNC